eukprot:gnl/Spiro4/18806_TR10055_c0_g1_i1.p1 gnl/Spiro4/18806_TR10055_c0_g1~~gnl/Spiro4/18806_TR10055_c0_g1_i1.p1  ORF type:complete len:284 (-),score=56.04 gnl/Spiro4/18806_TR10055_c0_g1_i1:77-898(-)
MEARMRPHRLFAVLFFLFSVVAAQSHSFHGIVPADILTRTGKLNRRAFGEFDKVSGSLKEVPASASEALCVLFAAREPELTKAVIGENVPFIDAAALWQGTKYDSVALFDGESTMEEAFPVNRLLRQRDRDDQVPSIFEATAAELKLPVRAQYLLVQHTIVKYSTSKHGVEYEIGVVPSTAGPGMQPNLCTLYITPKGDRNRNPYLNNGLPVIVIFTWKRENKYVFSNICFEENWFWSTGDVDVNVHSATYTKPTLAKLKDQQQERWPPRWDV